jgi:hypothetical protein
MCQVLIRPLVKPKCKKSVEARKFIEHRSVMTEEYHDELKAYLNKGLFPAGVNNSAQKAQFRMNL